MERLDLSNKVVAITGASRGLGAGLARVAARAGARLALCSRKSPALDDAASVLSMRLDVSDGDAVDRFAASAFQRFGQVDLWINNAGVLEPVGPLRSLETKAIERLLAVNILGVALGSRAYLQELHRRDARGMLINISSGAARRSLFGWSMYGASQAAVDRMTETIAIEEGKRLTAVYSIGPGVIDTEMQAAIRSKTETEFRDVQRFREMQETNILKSPEEAAAKILRFAFDADTPRSPVCVDLR